MNEFTLKNHIIAGGLTYLNDKNVELREIQIKDGLIIHTCNDYGKSIEVIKEASFNIKDKVKIISKVYFNYPDVNHRRFRSLFSQIQEQRSRLGFNPLGWQIQLCCYCSINQLISKNAQEFFKKIKREFGISKIFLEFYPIYNYDNNKIQILNNFYDGKITFGFIGYQNLRNRIFNEKHLITHAKNSTQLIFIGILGKGKQNKSIPENFNKDFISKNIIYFLNNLNNNKFTKGITNFSSKQQYEKFNDLFINLQEKQSPKFIDEESNLKIKGKIFYFQRYDQYGGFYSLKEYFLKPKLILSRLKRIFLSKIKARRFSSNYFG